MKLKNAISRLASGRTACEKADEIIELVKDQDMYLDNRSTIDFCQREVLQIAGRIDAIHRMLSNCEAYAEGRAEE